MKRKKEKITNDHDELHRLLLLLLLWGGAAVGRVFFSVPDVAGNQDERGGNRCVLSCCRRANP